MGQKPVFVGVGHRVEPLLFVNQGVWPGRRSSQLAPVTITDQMSNQRQPADGQKGQGQNARKVTREENSLKRKVTRQENTIIYAVIGFLISFVLVAVGNIKYQALNIYFSQK